MRLFELILVAVGLAMDAFAVAVTIGLAVPKPSAKHLLTVGLYFGGFQAVMPLIGYALGAQFAHRIDAFSHWIAFVLLAFIGGKMIVGSLSKSDDKLGDEKKAKITHMYMLPLAFATSIDALVVGVSFALLRVDIIPAVILIGIITLALSVAGVRLGGLLGAKFKTKAECLGGIVLVLMGLHILFEGLVSA